MDLGHGVQGGVVGQEPAIQEAPIRPEVGGGCPTAPGCPPHQLLWGWERRVAQWDKGLVQNLSCSDLGVCVCVWLGTLQEQGSEDMLAGPTTLGKGRVQLRAPRGLLQPARGLAAPRSACPQPCLSSAHKGSGQQMGGWWAWGAQRQGLRLPPPIPQPHRPAASHRCIRHGFNLRDESEA